MAKKMYSQGQQLIIREPARGPTTGAMEWMPISTDMVLVSSLPRKTSTAMARASTSPPPPARPCRKRQATIMGIPVAKAHSAEEMANSTREIRSGPRRPMASDKGPIKNCPRAMPRKQEVRVSCTAEGSVLKN